MSNVRIPDWLNQLMDLLDLDIVERAGWIRAWERFAKGEGGFFLNSDQIEEARRIRAQLDSPDLGRALVKLGIIGERERLQSQAQEMGVGFVDLDRVRIQPRAIRAADRDLATKHRAIPVKLDMPTLYLAVSNPHDWATIDAFKARTGLRIVPVLALPSEIDAAIAKYYPEG